jgi:hypothetical protein
VYRSILGPVYDSVKEDWRILTKKEIYAVVKNSTITETVRLNRLHWFGHAQRREGSRMSPQKYYICIWKKTGLEGRPRNRWQDEVREDGRLVGEKGWKERVYNREEWKKLLRTARNHRILHMAVE